MHCDTTHTAPLLTVAEPIVDEDCIAPFTHAARGERLLVFRQTTKHLNLRSKPLFAPLALLRLCPRPARQTSENTRAEGGQRSPQHLAAPTCPTKTGKKPFRPSEFAPHLGCRLMLCAIRDISNCTCSCWHTDCMHAAAISQRENTRLLAGDTHDAAVKIRQDAVKIQEQAGPGRCLCAERPFLCFDGLRCIHAGRILRRSRSALALHGKRMFAALQSDLGNRLP